LAARQRLVLAQIKVDAEANEITAIPALLELMDEGAVVTDAMGSQCDIAEKKADYLLALKRIQGSLSEDVKSFANEQGPRVVMELFRRSRPFDVRLEQMRRCYLIYYRGFPRARVVSQPVVSVRRHGDGDLRQGRVDQAARVGNVTSG
jgi:hypothetical protein